MVDQILDGKGSGKRAEVDTNNRLSTTAVTLTRAADNSSRHGDAFVVSTDFISMTNTGSFSAILYMKNTGTEDIFIKTLRTCTGGATMESTEVRLLKNPTAGTIVDDAIDASVTSMNLGSSNTLTGLYYKGSDSKTFTDGTHMTQFINHQPGHSTQEYDGALIVSKGQSLGIEIKVGAAADFCLELMCWQE
jgi:hypothetical protein